METNLDVLIRLGKSNIDRTKCSICCVRYFIHFLSHHEKKCSLPKLLHTDKWPYRSRQLLCCGEAAEIQLDRLFRGFHVGILLGKVQAGSVKNQN